VGRVKKALRICPEQEHPEPKVQQQAADFSLEELGRRKKKTKQKLQGPKTFFFSRKLRRLAKLKSQR
jgi:hypothetical protein